MDEVDAYERDTAEADSRLEDPVKFIAGGLSGMADCVESTIGAPTVAKGMRRISDSLVGWIDKHGAGLADAVRRGTERLSKRPERPVEPTVPETVAAFENDDTLEARLAELRNTRIEDFLDVSDDTGDEYEAEVW